MPNNSYSFCKDDFPYKVEIGTSDNINPFLIWVREILELDYHKDFIYQENVWMGNHVDHLHRFFFKNEEDAIAFKIAWL